MGDPVMSIEMRLALTSRHEWLQWKRLKASATAGSSELVSNTSQDWILIVQRPVKVDLDQLVVPAGLEIPFPAEAAPPVAPLLQTDEPRLTDAPRAQELNPWATAGAQSSTPQERSAVATMPEERAARTAEQPQLQQPSKAWPANPPQQPQRPPTLGWVGARVEVGGEQQAAQQEAPSGGGHASQPQPWPP